MIERVIESGITARRKILKGAMAVDRYVGMSLGPAGRNAIVFQAYKAPSISNDGVFIARNIVMKDPIEDLGAQTVIEASMQTGKRAGDGTTTTVVIACKLIEECAKKIELEDQSAKSSGIDSGADVIGMSVRINEAKELVLKALKSADISRPIEKGDIKNIIATSLGKMYPEYIDDLTEVIDKVGLDGYVSVEDNWSTKYGVEIALSQGMRFLGSYASPLFSNTRNREAIMEDVLVLVTNHRLEALSPIQELLKALNGKGVKRLVIISEGFSAAVTKLLAATTLQAKSDPRLVSFLLIKAPSLTTDQFLDVISFTGGRFFDKNISERSLENATIDMLGHVRRIVVDEDNTTMEGGKGDIAGSTKERIETLKAEMEIEKDSSFKEQTKRRIGALASGFAIIRVGAATEPEREYIRFKMEDAIFAAKAAIEEGVVAGGGLALKTIAEQLGKENILYGALIAPYERIKSNAGGTLKVSAKIIDPVKVTRLAVENACSVAGKLITAEVGITEKKESIVDRLEQSLRPDDNEDFRAEENQDLAYRT